MIIFYILNITVLHCKNIYCIGRTDRPHVDQTFNILNYEKKTSNFLQLSDCNVLLITVSDFA